ncbi:transporter substrate-binding domain-containing protein [Microbacterium sp.]|uniref:transporter substrate-binding domain-containing protein n=1 Tax=Microbacterium sp. TaxID=51671 RepID=UPI003A84D4A8
MMSLKHRAQPIALALAGAALLAVAGCASTDGTGAGGDTPQGTEIYGVEVPFDQDLRDMLPADILEKNTLVFSTDAAAPPRVFVDENGEIAGVIPDMLTALGATLGVEIDLQKNSFDAEVPGVESGRFDSTTGTGDFESRREILDMVDWFGGGYLYLVQAGNPQNIGNEPTDQCGVRIGVLKGTTQEVLVEELNAACEAEGLPPAQMQAFTNVLLSVPLYADRVDVVWESAAAGLQAAKDEPEKFEVAGDVKMNAYLAFGVKKDRPELRDTLQQTLQKLLDDGPYMAIAEHWGQEELAIDYISINSDVRP